MGGHFAELALRKREEKRRWRKGVRVGGNDIPVPNCPRQFPSLSLEVILNPQQGMALWRSRDDILKDSYWISETGQSRSLHRSDISDFKSAPMHICTRSIRVLQILTMAFATYLARKGALSSRVSALLVAHSQSRPQMHCAPNPP